MPELKPHVVDRILRQCVARVRSKRPQTAAVPRCRVCGCTEERACSGGCSWVVEGLCSVCARPLRALVEWGLLARAPNWAALEREYRRRLAGFHPGGAR